MAPRNVGELASGMAHDGHIHRKNHEFISIEGLAPMSTFSHSPDLRSRDLDPMAYGRHTLGTAHGGRIQKLTMTGGPTPSHVEDHDQVPHFGNPEPSGHSGQTHRMALKGHA